MPIMRIITTSRVANITITSITINMRVLKRARSVTTVVMTSITVRSISIATTNTNINKLLLITMIMVVVFLSVIASTFGVPYGCDAHYYAITGLIVMMLVVVLTVTSVIRMLLMLLFISTLLFCVAMPVNTRRLLTACVVYLTIIIRILTMPMLLMMSPVAIPGILIILHMFDYHW